MNPKLLLLACATAACGVAIGCGGSSGPANAGDDGGSGDDASTHPGDDSGSNGDTGNLGSPDSPACRGLECQVVDCAAMGKPPTTISGTAVTATPMKYGQPDPIYNAIVYVPNAPVQPFPAGVSCDKCGTAVSGSPVVVALSDTRGGFTLKDAPAGANIPLVVQIGRWRRQVTIPNVTACQDNKLPTSLTRLPHNKTEGDIPHIAIGTSTYDGEECILMKMGVDVAEFTVPSANGRVHLYMGNGSTLPGDPGLSALWGSAATLKQYDLVSFPCSSVPNLNAPPGPPGQNVVDYANAGGRVFATDLSYPWFAMGPPAWVGTSKWIQWTTLGVDPLPTTIDTSFPKGMALADWLNFLGATPTPGHLDITDTYHVVDGVNAPTTRWLYSTSPATVQTLSFNTPVGVADDQQCGRAVFNNFHVAAGEGGNNSVSFPGSCSPDPLTPQEKMIEFMLLDLSSCIQKDTQPPMPPPR